MAPQRRPGDLSYILIGRQLQYGTPITGAGVFDGTAPTESLAKLIRRHFVFVRNTLDADADTEQSESIYGGGAPDSIITGRGGAGEWEFELLPDDAIHILLGWFNPTNLPTNTPVSDQVIPDGAIAVSGKEVIIDTETAGAIANWPGKLKIEPTGASGAGKIRVTGQKRGSRSNKFNSPVTEEIAVADAAASVNSQNFFYSSNKMVLSGFNTAPTALKITYIPDTQWAELTLNENGSVFDGWSTQMIKALQAYIGYNVIPNLFRLTVGTNIRLLVSLLASYVQESRSLVDPTVTTDTLTNLQTILSKYPRSALDFYPSNGTAVVLGNAGESIDDLVARIDSNDKTAEPIAVTRVDIEGNHNFVDPEGYTGDPVAGQPQSSDTEARTVNVTASILHEVDDAETDNKTVHWQDRYFEGRRVPIVIRNYNWLSDGRQVLIEGRFPSCKLSEVPGLTIEGRGTPTRNLAFEAKRSLNATKPDEISMRFYSQKGFEE